MLPHTLTSSLKTGTPVPKYRHRDLWRTFAGSALAMGFFSTVPRSRAGFDAPSSSLCLFFRPSNVSGVPRWDRHWNYNDEQLYHERASGRGRGCSQKSGNASLPSSLRWRNGGIKTSSPLLLHPVGLQLMALSWTLPSLSMKVNSMPSEVPLPRGWVNDHRIGITAESPSPFL